MPNQSYLLDSHVAIWSIQDRGQLRADVIAAIDDPSNHILVSAASIWEIAIKRAAGRLHVPLNFIELVERAGYAELSVTFRHAEVAANLPLLHRDPFDRMMIAQAQVEGLTLVTDDSMITRYNVPTLDARSPARLGDVFTSTGAVKKVPSPLRERGLCI